MYFIVLEGAHIPTEKFGRPGIEALQVVCYMFLDIFAMLFLSSNCEEKNKKP